MITPLPDPLAKRLADAEAAATPDRLPRGADWLALALTAVAVPVMILLAGWAAR